MRSTGTGILTLVVGLLLGACAGTAPAVTAPTVTDQPSGDDAVYGGFTVDPPAPDEVVLTIVGARTVDLTMEELEALADVEVTLREPFVQREQTFSAVRLGDLLVLAGVRASDTIDTIALNDYRYSDRAGALIEADALLAVARDGLRIPMDAGGPIRLVFATDSPYHANLDAWNWSLRVIAIVTQG